jgi:hypothetical protein
MSAAAASLPDFLKKSAKSYRKSFPIKPRIRRGF